MDNTPTIDKLSKNFDKKHNNNDRSRCRTDPNRWQPDQNGYASPYIKQNKIRKRVNTQEKPSRKTKRPQRSDTEDKNSYESDNTLIVGVPQRQSQRSWCHINELKPKESCFNKRLIHIDINQYRNNESTLQGGFTKTKKSTAFGNSNSDGNDASQKILKSFLNGIVNENLIIKGSLEDTQNLVSHDTNDKEALKNERYFKIMAEKRLTEVKGCYKFDFGLSEFSNTDESFANQYYQNQHQPSNHYYNNNYGNDSDTDKKKSFFISNSHNRRHFGDLSNDYEKSKHHVPHKRLLA